MMYTSDHKMLLLMEILQVRGDIKFENDFCKAIGIRKSNLSAIKNGNGKHFTPKHIEMAIKVFGADGNWIFGVSNNTFIGNKKGHIDKKYIEIINKTE